MSASLAVEEVMDCWQRTLDLDSLTLSPMASLAAEALVPIDALESFATPARSDVLVDMAEVYGYRATTYSCWPPLMHLRWLR